MSNTVASRALGNRSTTRRSVGSRAIGQLKNNPIILVTYAVLILNCGSCLIPLIWTLSNSFRSNTQIFAHFSLIPEQLDFSNFVSMFTNTNIVSSFFNSVIITGLSLLLLLVCVLPCGFVLARFQFRFSRVIYSLFLLSIFVPGIVLLQAVYKIYANTGLLSVPFAIVLAYTAGQIPFSLFLMVAYMREIPASIEEAALLDGAGPWTVLTRIIVPMTRNGIVTIVILSFVAIWNDYIYALVFLPQPQQQTLTVALAAAKGEYAVSYGLLSAAAIMAILPVFIFYLFTKNLLMSGMSAGAVKG
jgi:ABC-type glycerol-3-phosphate transport system permease component